MTDEKKLSLRVFKRSGRTLVLLWKRIPDADPNKAEIVFKSLKDNKTIKVATFTLDEPLVSEDGGKLNVSSDTVICVIHEDPNDLDPKATYYVKVNYGGIEEGIRLTPAGSFPSHEREDRKKNQHLYGWDDENNMWRKLCAVKGPKGQYFLGVKNVPCSSCGFDGGENS